MVVSISVTAPKSLGAGDPLESKVLVISESPVPGWVLDNHGALLTFAELTNSFAGELLVLPWSLSYLPLCVE